MTQRYIFFRPSFSLLWLGTMLGILSNGYSQTTSNNSDGTGRAITQNEAQSPPSKGETELNILMSYYEQDGNHGAVEGGIGTQQLTDITPTLILNIPLDSSTRLSANLGVDIYASASTDRINQVLSSPSAQDTRYHADFGYSRTLKGKRTIVGLGAGFSSEYDYLSINLAASWAHSSEDGNREISIAGQVFFDRATLILPEELRGRPEINNSFTTNTRHSYNLNVVYSQVLHKRLQAALSTELVLQQGLLSTPFHRVYFRETGGAYGTAKTELLPNARYKFPIGLRVTYFATDLIQTRVFYRFYNDNFGISAHTFELETPLKVTPFFVLYPFYRFHTQTAARYFAPYLEHSLSNAFYSSDYDLAAFSSNKFGLGLRYSPVYGITRFRTPFKGRSAKLKSLDLRYAIYRQSTGLKAKILSAGLSFTMQ